MAGAKIVVALSDEEMLAYFPKDASRNVRLMRTQPDNPMSGIESVKVAVTEFLDRGAQACSDNTEPGFGPL